jgi:hypothetical protein
MRSLISKIIWLGLMFTAFFHAGIATAKMSESERKSFGTPMQLLSFEQLSHLEHTQRLKYVKQMRETYREFERMQRVFSVNVYSFVPDKKTDKALYALFFGDSAFAQNYGRGSHPTDQCLLGYQLSQYANKDARRIQPSGCQVPESAKCNGSSGPGVKCGYEISGLRGNMPEACIPLDLAYKATEECDRVRIQKGKDNQTVIQANIKKAKDFFKLGVAEATVNAEKLNSDEAKALLKDFMDHAYDDETYAHLLKILSLYKKAGINLDLGKLDPAYAGVSLESMAETFDKSQKKINKAFNDFKNHCDQKVDAGVLKDLSSEEWQKEVTKNAKDADSFWQREQKRNEAKKNYDKAVRCQNLNNEECNTLRSSLGITSGQPIEYTVKNIMEPEACKAFAQRLDSVSAKYEQIAGSYPAVLPNQPFILPTPTEPKPEPPYHVTPTGCSQRVSRDKDLLAQESAQCLICAAEKAVQNSAKKISSGSSYNNEGKTSTVSRKWMALLSTMVLACGDGQQGQRMVDMPNMLAYMQTFGHCDSSKYEWSSDQKTNAADKALVNKWQTDQGYWVSDKDVKKPSPDKEKDFERIYGMSYKTASKMFCDRERFDKTWFGRLKNLDPKKKKEGLKEFMHDRRVDFRKNKKLVRADKKAEYSAANDAINCMNQAVERTEELYVSGKGYCLATADVKSASNNQFEKFRSDAHAANVGLIAYSNSSCSVHQLNENSTKYGVNLAGFVRPMSMPEGDASVGIGTVPQHKRPSIIELHSSKGKESSPQSVKSDLLNSGFMSFTYASDEDGCPIAEGEVYKKPIGSTKQAK